MDLFSLGCIVHIEVFISSSFIDEKKVGNLRACFGLARAGFRGEFQYIYVLRINALSI